MQVMTATLFRRLDEQRYKFSMITTGISSHVRCPLEEKGVRLLSQFFVERRSLFKKTCDGLFFSTSVANETENLITNIWFKLNQWAKNTISNIMKESVVGTSLKENEKNYESYSARKTTVSKLKKQRYKFPQRLRSRSRRRRATTTLSCN